jgi:hypothetical protein
MIDFQALPMINPGNAVDDFRDDGAVVGINHDHQTISAAEASRVLTSESIIRAAMRK